MDDESTRGSWWKTLPGVLTAVGALVTALMGGVVGLKQAGIIFSEGKPRRRARWGTRLSPLLRRDVTRRELVMPMLHLGPPCMRQRPLGIAGARQAVHRRVRARQRRAWGNHACGVAPPFPPVFVTLPTIAWSPAPT